LPQEYEERAVVKDLVDRLMGTNPAVSLPRAGAMREAMKKLDESESPDW